MRRECKGSQLDSEVYPPGHKENATIRNQAGNSDEVNRANPISDTITNARNPFVPSNPKQNVESLVELVKEFYNYGNEDKVDNCEIRANKER